MSKEIYEADNGIILLIGTLGRSKYDGRTCFGIAFYENEVDANRAAMITKENNNRYNGGFFHGRPCGRESQFDHEKEGVKWYAVTY